MLAWPNTVMVGDFLADLVDDAGAGFRVTAKLTGWVDAPPIRSAIEDRSQQDGGFDAPGLFSSRVLTLAGFVEAPAHGDALAVMDQLNALLPRERYLLTVDNAAIGPRSAWVRVTTGVVIEEHGQTAFSYTITFTAPDHLKYGPDWQGSTTLAGIAGSGGRKWSRVWRRDWGVPAGVTPGSVFVPNNGLAPYWPRLIINGPVPNPTVRCLETGDVLRFDGTLLAGQWLNVDGRERHVTFGRNLDDVRYLADVTGNWLAVPPGGATFTFDGDTADPAASLDVLGWEGAWV